MLKKTLSAYENNINEYLLKLYENTAELTITGESPIIIFSDLHMGNGKKGDDFKKNALLFNTALKEYYLKKNFTLILNGDIEELQKFQLNTIRKQWKDTYKLFDLFDSEKKLIKLTGNHDESISNEPEINRYNEKQAVRLRTSRSDAPIFIFHGHQASLYYRNLNKLNTFFLRYIVNPIGIKNFSKKFRHEKKMRIEKRSYNFSRKNRLISIIGHTHRPLFESLSRSDSLHFSIEQFLRKYRKANPGKRRKLAEKIKELKYTYDKCLISKPDYEPASLMYSKGIPVPCLFNTGCAIGKRGITGIEITADKISLVHWFDSKVSSRFLSDYEFEPKPLSDAESIHRIVLRQDSLNYISDSINLLTPDKIKDLEDYFLTEKYFSNPEKILTKSSFS